MGNPDNSVVRRDFKKNPITTDEMTNCHWYVVVNDLIGGWSVATANKPESQQNVYEGEYEIATFVIKEVAEHMVKLHNQWWDNSVWSTYTENVEAGIAKEIFDYYNGPAPLPEGVLPLTEDDWFHYDD